MRRWIAPKGVVGPTQPQVLRIKAKIGKIFNSLTKLKKSSVCVFSTVNIYRRIVLGDESGNRNQIKN